METKLIQGLLHDPTLLTTAQANGLRSEHFTDPYAKSVWKTMVSLEDMGVTPTAELVSMELYVPVSGGEPIDPSTVVYVVDRLKKDYRARCGWDLLSRATNEGTTEEDLVAVQYELERILGEREQGHGVHKISDHLVSIDSYIKDDRDGLYFGFSKMDKLLGGLKGGEVFYIGGRPSVGKTIFVQQCARNVANKGTGVLFFSIEMSARLIMERMLFAEAGVDMDRRRFGMLTDKDREKLEGAAQHLSKLPFFIDDSGSMDIHTMRALIKQYKKIHNIGFVVIDYLQLIGGNYTDQRLKIIDIGRMLKQISKEEDLAVFCVSALKRTDHRESKKPVMTDFRESSNIEYDADGVILLYKEDPTDSTVYFNLDKRRNGPTGGWKLELQQSMCRFMGDTTGYEGMEDFE